MTLYCTHCWAEVTPTDLTCPQCGAALSARSEGYAAKLIAALRHPEPFTRRRAAYVLGLLREPAAVEALAAVLAGPDDPYVKGEAAHALDAIGGRRAEEILRQTADDKAQPAMVRQTAAAALRNGHPGSERDINHG